MTYEVPEWFSPLLWAKVFCFSWLSFGLFAHSLLSSSFPVKLYFLCKVWLGMPELAIVSLALYFFTFQIRIPVPWRADVAANRKIQIILYNVICLLVGSSLSDCHGNEAYQSIHTDKAAHCHVPGVSNIKTALTKHSLEDQELHFYKRSLFGAFFGILPFLYPFPKACGKYS